jgi:hypothetical protein
MIIENHSWYSLKKPQVYSQRAITTLFKGISGCYVIAQSNTILYIGMSKNIYNRILSHKSNGGIFYAFDWDTLLIIPSDEYKELEKYLIHTYKPTYNGRLTGNIYKKKPEHIISHSKTL